jgi:RNA polymerase sigma-70 factor, ECF subfamily
MRRGRRGHKTIVLLRTRPRRGEGPVNGRCLVIEPPGSIAMTTLAGLAEPRGWPARQSTVPRRLDPATLGDHVDRLYRAARTMCSSREEAEDLVQETFARVLQRPRFLHSEDDIGYLLRVLKNTFVSGCRTAARRPQASDSPDELTWIEDPAAPRPEARLESAALYAAIDALPASFRDALVAVDVLGLSYDEASRALRVREGTITTRLHRARQRVATSLADEAGISPVVRHAP